MYEVSPITVLDEDKELFETHIGLDNKEKTLVLSVWGSSEGQSREAAINLAEILNSPKLKLC